MTGGDVLQASDAAPFDEMAKAGFQLSANSLQIIAGIILMKANTVSSEETRPLFQDIHDRVISMAAVQRQLHASGTIGPIEMVAYLTRLSDALATSMIADARPVTVKVVGEGGTLNSRQAESVGLITTERKRCSRPTLTVAYQRLAP